MRFQHPCWLRVAGALLFLGLALAWSGWTAAQEPKPGEKITYMDHVRPIFREHCFNCHNQNKATNDLALDSYERLRKGGASGEVINPGNPGDSYLWLLVNHESEPHMPPKTDKLPAAKLEIIRQWIAGGALRDSGSKAEAKPKPSVSLAVSAGATRPAGPPIMPEGLSRQPATTTPRAGAVTALAASPWAPLVAVAGQRQIVLYHADSAQLLGVLPFAEGIPYVLRFSRSGALLLAGGGENARRGLVAVYDVKTGRRLFTAGDELDVVLAADISPDHKLVALGGPEKIVRVFNTADGAQLYEIRKHTDWIYAVEFSPDGILLATADRSGGLVVWEADTGREYQNLEGHKAGVTSVSFRDDANVLASGSEDGTIKLWNLEDGRVLKSQTAHGAGVTAIQFGHDGRLASAGRDRLARLWSPDLSPVRTFAAFQEPVLELALTHDGQRLAAGDWSGEVRLYSTADGKQVGLLPPNPTAEKKSASRSTPWLQPRKAAMGAAPRDGPAQLAYFPAGFWLLRPSGAMEGPARDWSGRTPMGRRCKTPCAGVDYTAVSLRVGSCQEPHR